MVTTRGRSSSICGMRLKTLCDGILGLVTDGITSLEKAIDSAQAKIEGYATSHIGFHAGTAPCRLSCLRTGRRHTCRRKSHVWCTSTPSMVPSSSWACGLLAWATGRAVALSSGVYVPCCTSHTAPRTVGLVLTRYWPVSVVADLTGGLQQQYCLSTAAGRGRASRFARASEPDPQDIRRVRNRGAGRGHKCDSDFVSVCADQMEAWKKSLFGLGGMATCLLARRSDVSCTSLSSRRLWVLSSLTVRLAVVSSRARCHHPDPLSHSTAKAQEVLNTKFVNICMD